MKKHWGILVAATLAAACGSNNSPPAASAASVDQASSTPTASADFAPAANDGTASASADARHPTNNDASAKASAPTSAAENAAPDSPAPVPVSNAAASPGRDAPATAPDNSRVNKRDTTGKTLTPMDQGPSEGDRKITQQVRQAVIKDGTLSFTAKNVKIITINGTVTLRGPVKTEAERSAIEAAAKNVAGVAQVDNQLEVKN